MKIGIITDFFPMYGAKSVAKLISALEEQGHSAIVLSSNRLQNGQYTKTGMERYGEKSKLMRYPSFGFAPGGTPIVVPPQLPFVANKLFNHERVDIAHVHFLASYSFQMYSLMAHFGKNRPLIGTPHGVVTNYSSMPMKIIAAGIRAASRLALKTIDSFTVVSKQTKPFLESLGVAGNKIQYIPNGIDDSIFKPIDKKESEKKLNLETTGKIRILFLAHLRQTKGLDVLMDVAKSITSERSDVEFLIIGSGPLKSYVRKQCESNPNQLSHLDYIDENLLQYGFNCADIYVLPSFVEGLPQSLLEAMACGVASIATDVGGVSELFNKQTKIGLISPGNRNQLRERIEVLINDDSRRRKLGTEQRRIVQERYTLSKTSQKYISLYNDTLETNLNN